MTHRIDQSVTALVAGILLAYASVSGAQPATPPAGTPTARPTGAASSPSAAAVRDLRLSQLIGMDVRNAKGENLGDVKDVVVDVDSGRVAYAVVGIGGVLGIGEKLSAFPMGAFRMAQAPAGTAGSGADRMADNDGVKGDRGPIGSDRAEGTRSGTTAGGMLSGRGPGGLHLVLDADPRRLKQAPNFDRKAWPDWNDARFRGEVDRAAGTSAAAGKAGRMLRGSQLLDADIRDPAKKNVGELEDLVLDVKSGQVRYAVVDFDQAWTPDDKLVAVPMKALRPTGDAGELVFAGERSQLERAPSFDKGRWPDLNGGTFRGEVDRYVSGWRASDASGAATPGSGMTSAPTDRSKGTTASRSGAAGGGSSDPAPTGSGGTAAPSR